MADALIETMSSNPYDGIIADTSTQISNIDAQIQQVTSAINKLEQVSPTSPTLSQLKERLASLQSQKEWLTTTNESARTLSDSFTKSSVNLNTLKWIYDVKQQELERAKAQDDAAYRKMYEDTQRQTNNYINALWNATSSENAIINANAWRQWASAQSTAEARARNYLSNAQAQNEAANTVIQQLNAIEEWRITSNQWYTQLSQSNADNYLRQQVMNDFQTAEAEKDRQLNNAKYSWWWSWSWSYWQRKLSPDLLSNLKINNNKTNQNDILDPVYVEENNFDTPATDKTTSDIYENKYWSRASDVAHYQNNFSWQWTLTNWKYSEPVAYLDRSKVSNAVNNINKQYNEWFNLDQADWYITDKWYVVLIDNENRQRTLPLSDVSWDKDSFKFYRTSDWNIVKY